MEPGISNRPPLKLNIGCGSSVVLGYENLDNSMSLLIQQNAALRGLASMLEWLMRQRIYTRFPPGVSRVDVRRPMPYDKGSIEVIYSSHMLEHLPREEAEVLLRDSFRVLIPRGILRLALPDLEQRARKYIERLDRSETGEPLPADEFLRNTLLGTERQWRFRQPAEMYRALFGRKGHYWMWDALSLCALLEQIGFVDVKQCGFRVSAIEEISELDLERRKDESFYVEARKP